MGFINAIKIAFSRISLVFKVLLYDLIIAGIMTAICAGVLLPQFSEVGTELAQLNIGDKLVENIHLWLTGDMILSEVIAALYATIEQVIVIIGSKLLSLAFITIVLAALVAKFLLGLRTIPTYDIVNSHMTESSNYYFLGNLMRNAGRSCKFSLVNMLFGIPCDLIIIAIVYFGIGLLIGWLGIFALPLMVILVICLIAFKNTIFYLWLPCILQGKPIFKSFAEAVKLAFKHFADIFFTQITYLLFALVVLTAAMTMTFGAGLLVAVPLLFIIHSAMKLAKYYDINKMRYYVTMDNVVTPTVIEEIEVSDTEADYEAETDDTEA